MAMGGMRSRLCTLQVNSSQLRHHPLGSFGSPGFL